MADVPPPPGEEQFQSLYRRYRPQRFEDVRGQDHVTRALRNAVRDDRVAHAYLFSGPRGTGKTSTARILAMALNCEQPVDGEPDGTCASCVAIRRGSSVDVHELDAASNRRIDEIRELLARVALGTRGRWKVYIIDEVHQLTGDASSALLKTLEEPPGHVVFVLATTDPQKVLPTIRSRTQHFEFRLLGSDVLVGLLRDINERAALGLAPEAIDLVVRRGHGSARDALSVLDQVAAAGDIEDETGVVAGIVDAVADQDAGRVLTAVAEAVSAGRDPRRLAADLLDHLRNGFLATQARGLVLLPDDAALEVEAQARRMGLPGVVRAMEGIGQAAVDMRDALDPRVTLEVALVRLAAPRTDSAIGALMARVDHLERLVAGLGAPSQAEAPAGDHAPSGPLPGPASPPGPAVTPGPVVAPAPGAERAAAPAPGGVPILGAPAPAGADPVAVPPGPTSPPLGAAPRASRPHTGEAPSPPGRRPVEASPPQPRRLAPGRPPAQAPGRDAIPGPSGRATLGAHRRAAPPGNAGPPAPPGNAGPPASSGATPAGPASPVQSPPPDGRIPPGAGPDVGAGAAASGHRAGSTDGTGSGAPGGSDGAPSRDELTTAWGDHVLPGLVPAVKAYVSAGRFVAVDGATAVYALPDAGLLRRAEPVRGAVEGALASHFGRPVAVRFVLDGDAPAVAPSPGAVADAGPDADDPSTWDFHDLTDAGPGVVSPEQRLLEAFPGAEEVTP